jgi:hypothetical protein
MELPFSQAVVAEYNTMANRALPLRGEKGKVLSPTYDVHRIAGKIGFQVFDGRIHESLSRFF